MSVRNLSVRNRPSQRHRANVGDILRKRPFIASDKALEDLRSAQAKHADALANGTRTITAEFCGDPLPGRSALDRKLGA